MKEEGIHIETLPELQKPILIVGFGGWGIRVFLSYRERDKGALCRWEIF